MKSDFKLMLNRYISALLNDRIASAKVSIESAVESRNSDTKSSAGDKYETGRAMMQMEIDLNRSELEKAEALLNDLASIDPLKAHSNVGSGSLVITNHGNYYISVGIGKVTVEGVDCFVISSVAPLAITMKNKQKDDVVPFGDREYHIIQIY